MKVSKRSIPPLTALLAAILLLSGCATPARVSQMTIGSTDAADFRSRSSFLNKEIQIGQVSGGSKTNPAWTSEIDSDSFRMALEDSLYAADMLNRNQQADYELHAQMVEVKQPLMGLDLTVTVTVHYTLVRRSDEAPLFDEKISAYYTAHVSDALIAIERLKLANEGAARENIKQLIDTLFYLKLGSNVALKF